MVEPIALTDKQLDELIASLNTRLGIVDTDPIEWVER